MLDLLKTYIENKIQLAKFELISISANLAAKLISFFVIMVLALTILLMVSVALAYGIGQYFNSIAIGFAIVGGVYLLFFILYIAFARGKVEKIVKDHVVKIAIQAHEDLAND